MRIKAFIAGLSVLALGAQPALSNGLGSGAIDFAFGGTTSIARPEAACSVAAPHVLSDGEMAQTEGEVAPLVAIGVMTAGRFIVQRYVAPTVARSVVRNGGSVMTQSRQQAAAIARSASNGGRPIREFHAGSGQRFTHYHPNPRNGGHVWYGRGR